MKQEHRSILRLAVLLTLVFILMQATFILIHAHASGMDGSVIKEFNSHLLAFTHFFTPAKFYLIAPVFIFLFLQCLIYFIYIFLLWFTAVSVAELLELSHQSTRYLTYFIWFVSVALIISGNMFFIPHAYFSQLVQNDLLLSPVSPLKIRAVFTLALLVSLTMIFLALLNAGKMLFSRRGRKRDWTVFVLVVFVLYVTHTSYKNSLVRPDLRTVRPDLRTVRPDLRTVRPDLRTVRPDLRTVRPEEARSAVSKGISHVTMPFETALRASSGRTVGGDDIRVAPSVIILGFDALRPDYLSYFNPHRQPTPTFDAFLQQSSVFTQTYTPDARTFPSWLSILTGQYPRHHQGRDDNQDLSTLAVTQTLATRFKQLGYETIFASDDNRFNNINQTQFGFDHFIGPTGNAIDMVISGMNDLPLSNLLITTPIGKWLFAGFIGNHGTPQLYEFNDFLPQLQQGLQQRDANKPVFLVAHINSTAWPFFFLQHQVRSNDDLTLYKAAVAESDVALSHIMQTLKAQGLLNHTIFVLLSDHGITLQLPNDRVIAEKNYLGDVRNMLVKRTPYRKIQFSVNGAKVPTDNDEVKIIPVTMKTNITDVVAQQAFVEKLQSPFNPLRFGVDTTFGYGTDILSLKQNHSLLAIRFFNLQPVPPRQIQQRVLTIDIAPTILDMLGLPALAQTDGISLKPLLLNPATQLAPRSFFFETSFTVPEMEQGGIQVNQVLRRTMKLYQINPENALLSVIPAAEKIAIQNKERSVLEGDWLLAYYPASQRDKFNFATGQLEHYIQPPYNVLVNIKSGQWTTNLQPALAQTAPVNELIKQIHKFYGKEL